MQDELEGNQEGEGLGRKVVAEVGLPLGVRMYMIRSEFAVSSGVSSLFSASRSPLLMGTTTKGGRPSP